MAEVKKIAPTKPVEVKVESGGEVFFVTVFKNGSLEVRPKGIRRPESTAITTVHSIYQRIIMQASTNQRRRPVKRGLLSLGLR